MFARWMAVACLGIAFALCGCAQEAPPSAAPVKSPEASSNVEVNHAMAECLQSRGWDPRVGRQYLEYNGPPEQKDAYMADFWQCYKDLGFAELKPPEYTPQYLAKKYSEAQSTRECLRENGEDAPELPSLQTYTDMFFNEGKIYSTYEYLSLSLEEANGLRAICGDPLEAWGTDMG